MKKEELSNFVAILKKKETENTESFDIKPLIYKLIFHWKFLITAGFAILFLAVIFVKIYPPVYLLSTTVLVQEQPTNTNSIDPFQSKAMAPPPKKNILNEKEILHSYTIYREAISRLDYSVSYFQSTKLIFWNELYNESPIKIVYDSEHPQLVGLPFKVTVLPDFKFLLEGKGKNISVYDYKKNKELRSVEKFEIEKQYSFGQLIDGPDYSFRILMLDSISDKYLGDKFKFVMHDLNVLTFFYLDKVKVELVDPEISICNLSLKGNNIQKTADFLNMVTHVYTSRDLDRKNQKNDNTVSFIDSQLLGITDSLQITEGNLENFKSSNKLMDINFQTQETFKLYNLQKEQLSNLNFKLKNYVSIKDKLLKNVGSDQIIIPSSSGIDDKTLIDLISKLTDYSTQKNAMLFNSKERSQQINALNDKIENTKRLLLENLENNIKSSTIEIENLKDNIAQSEKEINQLPQKERNLLRYERIFKLNDELYTHLLQRRTDSQIEKYTNLADSEVIDPAVTGIDKRKPNFPKKLIIYLIALFLGATLPAAFILIRDFMKNLIIERKNIESLTDIPIIGYIYHFKRRKEIKKFIIDFEESSAVADSIRSLPTSIDFLKKEKKKQTILVTSSLSGEGKSFIASNLAAIYARYGLKTVIISFDLRKPVMHEIFGLNMDNGIASYILGSNNIESIIQKTNIDNLHLICSGDSEINPLEIITNTKTEVLINTLKNIYDRIIIDTTSIGLLADTYVLMKYSDLNMLVIRQNYTNQEAFKSVIKELEFNNIENLCIVVNDLHVITGSGFDHKQLSMYDYKYKKRKQRPSFIKRVKEKIIKIKSK